MFLRIFFVLLLFFSLISTGYTASPYYDSFSGSKIDLTKWQNCESGEIEDGQLRLKLLGANSWLSTNCYIVEENITNYISSLVTISRDSYASTESSVAVKIGGVFYNDTYDGYSGYNNWQGNVFADIRLQLYKGHIHARAVVVRYNNSTGSSKTPTSAYFTLPINFETQYLLSIQFVGSKIIFKCNDETLTYYIRTHIYPTNKLWRGLTAMIYADMSEKGYVIGFFDDVCLAEACMNTSFLPSTYKLLLKSTE